MEHKKAEPKLRMVFEKWIVQLMSGFRMVVSQDIYYHMHGTDS
jgi:hypothetical protein